MPLAKFNFKAGINKEETDYSEEGGYVDANFIRFRKNRPEKIGGWLKASADAFLGIARALHQWVSLGGTKYLGLGSTLKYYIERGSVFNDITPIRKTSTNSITFSATNGSATITATDSSHGAVQGDFVTISGAVSLGGLITASVLNTEHQIVTVPTANTYTFVASATANASDSGNGGSGVDGSYQINVGLNDYVQNTGWGSGAWSAGSVNLPSASLHTRTLPACDATVKVVSAVKLTTLALPAEINPANDLTGPEKVDLAIISSKEISSTVLACLLGQSVEQVKIS